ncbi:hypothetical protein [Cytobacillus oceanisediminis]|uniref:Uncharacterized protein n=1 Tax=Cytobacillus oceanisediminis 2691 TaxID=1196031 RepID=A0A160MEY0_9BACI|nr:hypothetical protein [Cytobacillus oceanisediminis]AND41473.1 hypothetical protein A361_20675 [Cytobacillus oceanisediminis 2691]
MDNYRFLLLNSLSGSFMQKGFKVLKRMFIGGDEVETNVLFYKIRKGTVSTEDYVNWSHSLLERSVTSPSIPILSSFTSNDNIFEVEVYFNRAIIELGIKEPIFEVCARAYIGLLADRIIQVNDHKEIFDLTNMIFQIVAMELDYPDELYTWFELNEMIDRLDYDYAARDFNEDDVILRIKNEAEIFLKS